VTLKLDWTANDGLSKGHIDIDVKVLPSTLILSTGKLTASGTLIKVTGYAIWTLYGNGNQTFAGGTNTDDVFEDDFVFAMASS
jgi:hypothetical protein